MTYENSTEILTRIDRLGGTLMNSLDRAAALGIVGFLAWAVTTSLLG